VVDIHYLALCRAVPAMLCTYELYSSPRKRYWFQSKLHSEGINNLSDFEHRRLPRCICNSATTGCARSACTAGALTRSYRLESIAFLNEVGGLCDPYSNVPTIGRQFLRPQRSLPVADAAAEVDLVSRSRVINATRHAEVTAT
jgi:hypothetical protein